MIRDTDGSVLKTWNKKTQLLKNNKSKKSTRVPCFDNVELFSARYTKLVTTTLKANYLPDVLEILKKRGEVVSAYPMKDFDEGMGVNDRVALSKAEKYMRLRINEEHMRNGVTLIDPEATYIESTVQISADTVIGTRCCLKR